MTLFLWFKLDLFTWPRIFCLYRPSKNLADFPSISLLGASWSASQRRRSGWVRLFDYCFDSAVHCGNHAPFAFGSWVLPLGFCQSGMQSLLLHLGFQVQCLQFPSWGLAYRTVVTELFQDCQGYPDKFISYSCGEGCVLWTLPGRYVGFKRLLHSNVPDFMSLWIPSSALN